MRLKCIKLSGFKSFVDPTTVHFPSNMCGVVGPNGCGKSNIIDAVRWVMGESSAKNLRGDSMTDVIFKGSNTRKPAAFAQVELVFDNSAGRITGEYAAYNEVSVKRRLSSDGQNIYFLNSGKCRRRDIMDIFLGTGLGPRSYSIISQGIVSNLIDSKPEELRVFIEEAAGISKYKERRRETENRMRRTGENLERLTDLRDELGRQLSHLEQQAEAAKKYKKFQQEMRLSKARLAALRWQEADSLILSQEGVIREGEIKLEAAIADQRSDDAKLEQLREMQADHTEKFHAAQTAYYGTGNAVTRLEQDIAHKQERKVQLEKDLQEIRGVLQETGEQWQLDHENIAELKEIMLAAEPEVRLVEEEFSLQSEMQVETEDRYQQWQQGWDIFSQRSGDTRHEAQLEQSRIQHFESSLERISHKVGKQEAELENLNNQSDQVESELLYEKLEVVAEQVSHTETLLGQSQQKIYDLRAVIEDILQRRNIVGSQLSEAKGRYASLAALQQSIAEHGEKSSQWLCGHNMNNNPRIAAVLRVQTGWERAVETVMGDALQAVCIDKLDAISSLLDSLTGTGLTFFACANDGASDEFITLENETLPRLSTLVEGSAVVKQQLRHIYAARNITQALSYQSRLESCESVITPEGIWLGGSWLRLACETEAGQGVLNRQKQIDDLKVQIGILESEFQSTEDILKDKREELEKEELSREQIQQHLTVQQQSYNEINSEIRAQKIQSEQFLQRKTDLEGELHELRAQQTQEQEHIGQSRIKLQNALDRMGEDAEKRESMLAERDQFKQKLEDLRIRTKESGERKHRMEMEYQSISTKVSSLQQALERLQQQKQRSLDRLTKLEHERANYIEPAEDLSVQLEQLLKRRSDEESHMQQSRRQLEEIEQQIRDLEKNRQSAESHAGEIRSQLEQLRMEWQALKIKRCNLQEQLDEDSFDLQTVLLGLDASSSVSGLSELIEKLDGRIKRLGAINLAAIEEFDQQARRKHYLDEQNRDLESALNTLEQAIKKIDKETRSRFKDTFEKVDSGLRALFPKVFGGGQAYLELTGDDMLETGVAIMAQPPGKKNSTIYMLSGGEKALTAIALVFAIFRLNPSPFCMLDEVDAPLDDANVGRYARMVSEMSEHVQFIYISHNKIAMEAASQLIGITMQEPGVSRPVSVDIEKAAAMSLG